MGGGIRKVVKFWLQVTFYGFLTFVILYITGYDLGMRILIGAVLPIPYNTWWFATSYFCLLILSKFVNLFINNVSRKQHIEVIIILASVYTILPMFMMAYMDSSNLLLFIMLYLTGAYIRIYDPVVLRKKCVGLAAVILCVFVCFSLVIFDLLGQWMLVFSNHARHFMNLDSCLIFAASVCIFSTFRNMSIKNSKAINTVAAGTFGIYLLHEHELMRDLIWIQIFKTNTYYDAPTMTLILHMIACCAIVFVVGSAVDCLYRLTLEKMAMKLWDKRYAMLRLKAKPYNDKINERF